MCNKLRDASKFKVAYTFLPYVFYYNILSKLQIISIFNLIDYKTQLFISCCLIYLSFKYSTRVSTGTHTPNTIKSVITYYILCLTMTGNVFLSLNIVAYFLGSEMIVDTEGAMSQLERFINKVLYTQRHFKSDILLQPMTRQKMANF